MRRFSTGYVLLRFFKHDQHLLTRHGRELIKKLFERFASCKTVKQVLDGDASTRENRRTPKLFRIYFNNVLAVRPSSSSKQDLNC